MDKEQAAQLLSKYDDSTKLFSLAGLKTYARVVGMHDLDTCTVVFPFQNNDVHKIIVRLLGIDSPEMNAKDPTVKAWAVKARNRMLSLMAPGVFEIDGNYARKDINKLFRENVALIWMDAKGWDKYGRCLADIYLSPDGTKSLQAICIEEGFCRIYDGGTKKQWVSEDCVMKPSDTTKDERAR